MKIYLSQSDLFYAVMDSRMKGYITNDLGEKFLLLATKCANHRNFVRYHHLKEEIIAIGAAACCKAFDKFRPFKDKDMVWDGEFVVYDHNICSNSFSFFTTVIFNDVIHFLKKEYKQSNIINEKRLESGLDASFGYVDMITDREANEEREAPIDLHANESVWAGSDEEDVDNHVIDWQNVSQS